MITDLNQDNLSTIRNPHLRTYAAIYARIYDDFMAQIGQLGLDIDPESYAKEVQERKAALRQNAAVVRNAGKSVVLNWLSPACEACRNGIGTATFFISLQCHRDCFYCFNGNQEDYAHYTQHTRDVVHELEQISAGGLQLDHIALTGGEPLLHSKRRSISSRLPTRSSPLRTSGSTPAATRSTRTRCAPCRRTASTRYVSACACTTAQPADAISWSVSPLPASMCRMSWLKCPCCRERWPR